MQKKLLKSLIKRTFLYTFLIIPFNEKKLYINYKIDYKKWLNSQQPIPPPHIVKQIVVKEFAKRNKIRILIETGTFLGEMVEATKNFFDKIYSIELNDELFKNAKKKFRRYKNIKIVKGDSSQILSKILNKMNEPCLFWLDGHYSGGDTSRGVKETPILEELNQIFKHFIDNHVILIDDARHFTGDNDYPAIKKIKNMILTRYPEWKFDVKYDIIRAWKSS